MFQNGEVCKLVYSLVNSLLVLGLRIFRDRTNSSKCGDMLHIAKRLGVGKPSWTDFSSLISISAGKAGIISERSARFWIPFLSLYALTENEILSG